MTTVSLAVFAATLCTAVLGLALAPWVSILAPLWPAVLALVFAAIAWWGFGPEPAIGDDADEADADADAEDDQ